MRMTLALLLGAGLCFAETHAPAVAGDWILTFEHPKGDYFGALSVEADGDRLRGSFSNMKGSNNVQRLAFADGALSGLVRGAGRLEARLEDGRLAGRIGRRRFTGRRAEGEGDPALDFARQSVRAAPRDGFPVLTDPPMAKAGDAKWGDREPVIGVTHNGQACAFPVTTMGIHELVNLTIGREPLAVSW